MAITKFIKDLFVVDVEEEVPVQKEQPKERSSVSKVTNLKTDKQTNSRHKAAAGKRKPETKSKLIDVKDSESKEKMIQSKRTQSHQGKFEDRSQSNRGENRAMSANNQSTKVCLFEPRVFAETQDIADELKSNRAALVNLTKIDSVAKKRIVDFLSGTVYALEGDIQRVGTDIFLCTPDSFGVEGEISDKEALFDEM